MKMVGLGLTIMLFLAGAAIQVSPLRVDSGPEHSFRDCADCPEMMVIPAGSFMMGALADEPGSFPEEKPQRRVSIRKFAAGRFDVTKGEWTAFVSATNRPTAQGCDYSGLEKAQEAAASWRHLGFKQDDNHPVVCVTWADTQDYLSWVSKKSGHKYRLPTEAEWEYAARAGRATAYPWGSSASHENANYGADKCCSGLALGHDQWVNTSPVGSFPPNAFGLHDMNGNVLQWVQDCFASSYSGLATDGTAYETDTELKMTGELADMSGTHSCAYRVLRGGNWGDPPAQIRSAFRNFAPPPGATLQAYRTSGGGFRVARTVE